MLGTLIAEDQGIRYLSAFEIPRQWMIENRHSPARRFLRRSGPFERSLMTWRISSLNPPAKCVLKAQVQILFTFGLLFLLCLPGRAASNGLSRQVLILNSYHQGFTWTDRQMAGLMAVFHRTDPDFDPYVEYMDWKRFPDSQTLQRLTELFRHLYAGKNLRLVITTDNAALQFALDKRKALFPRAAIVFSGINGFRDEMIAGQARVTGVVENTNPAGTLATALRLHPKTREILAIFDGTESGRAGLQAARQAAARLDRQIRFRALPDPTMAEVLKAVRQLPEHSLVLMGNFNRDRNGQVFSHRDALRLIVPACRVPIYGLWALQLGHGILGGNLLSGRLQGETAARLALRFLAGERDIPVVRTSPTRPMFDARQLQRFGISTAALPAGSAVLNRRLSLYQEYKGAIWATLAIFFLLTTIIAALLLNIRRRRQAEAGLRNQKDLLGNILAHIPFSVFWKDRHSVFLGGNANFARDAGLEGPEELPGKTDFDLPWTPSETEFFRKTDLEVVTTGEPRTDFEEELHRPGEGPTTVLTSKVPLKNADGRIYGVLGIYTDITQRKHRERELAAIARITSALRPAQSSREMIPILLDTLLELVQVNGAFFLLRDPESGHLVSEGGRGTFDKITRWRYPAEDPGLQFLLAAGRSPSHPTLAASMGNLPPGLEKEFEGVVCFPMIAHGQRIGALCAARKTPFPETEVRLLTTIADIAASAIHRSSLHEKAEKQVRRLSALRHIDQAIIGSLDLKLTLDVLLEQVRQQLNIDAASVFLFRPQLGMLEFTAGLGFRNPGSRKRTVRPGEGAAGRTAADHQARCLPDLSQAEEGCAELRAELPEEEGFAAYFSVPLESRGELKGVLELFHRSPRHPDAEWFEFLGSLGMQAAIAIDNASLFTGLQRSNEDLVLAYDRTIEGWSRALDLRDKETEGHSLRVTEMAVRLARLMGMADEELVHVRRGALLHDIGKVGIPDSILLKQGPLSEEEWDIMKRHPVLAYELLSPIDYLHPALDIPYCHHERWDGSGYPRGLKGEQIPLSARIFAVVDVWDALNSDRPYRPAWPEEKVRQTIAAESGTHFDPRVVEAFQRL
jgi:putative nucleotidyltransferase with HDIG domain/PAS domain S-box-containing protein